MIANVWDKITLYCMNHDEPLKMDIIQNETQFKKPFYACEHYASIPASQRKDKTGFCYNRISHDDSVGIILKFLELLDDSVASDITNMEFNYTSIGHEKYKVKVLKCKEDDIQLGVLNKTVLL